jgi:hypothetical protein
MPVPTVGILNATVVVGMRRCWAKRKGMLEICSTAPRQPGDGSTCKEVAHATPYITYLPTKRFVRGSLQIEECSVRSTDGYYSLYPI